MPADHYDVIVVGSGPGGGTLASRLAPTGKRILILERGDYLKREAANWDVRAVFGEGRYQAKETWIDKAGAPFNPGIHYYVGGNSKVYGSALVRLRREDFGELRHSTGVSPAWPITYDVLDPYYLEAEALYHVHGQRGEDPSEPNAASPFPYPPVEHEPHISRLSDAWARQGMKPFHLPLGILLDQKPGTGAPTPESACIRCAAFDGFPCLTNGKADAQIVCVDPMLKQHDNVTLLTGAYVSKLETDAAGRTITGVHVTRDGEEERYSADLVVVACGSLNSALLFLRSANAAHPTGLANRSDQVGRNYMRHIQSVFIALSRQRNDTVFQKTLASTDFYFGAPDWLYPMGFIQMCGKVHGEQVRCQAIPAWLSFLPTIPFDMLANHTIDLWLSSEDLPDPSNRISLEPDGKVKLALTDTNMIAHEKLIAKVEQIMDGTNESGSLSRTVDLHQEDDRGRRRLASGRHLAIWDGPKPFRARRRLQGARDRQSLRDGRKFLPVRRRGQPDIDDYRQLVAGRRPSESTTRVTSNHARMVAQQTNVTPRWLTPILLSRGGAAEPGTHEPRSLPLGPGFSLRAPP